MFYNTSFHQQKQLEVIEDLEAACRQNPNYSAVTPVDDFPNDTRLCLTSVHQISSDLSSYITSNIINPLKKVDPNHFFYSEDNLHLTIKNIRNVSDPPNFSVSDEQVTTSIFSSVVPRHQVFHVYYYRLIVLSTSVALIGTTDPELDNIIFDLDENLTQAGIPDDKKYVNSKYFISNICILRLTHPITPEFNKAIQEVSQSISLSPYLVDSVTLAVCNGVFQKRRILGTWELK